MAHRKLEFRHKLHEYLKKQENIQIKDRKHIYIPYHKFYFEEVIES